MDIVKRLREYSCGELSCDECNVDREAAADEIERLQLYERAMVAMAAQLIHPTMTAEELAKVQLDED